MKLHLISGAALLGCVFAAAVSLASAQAAEDTIHVLKATNGHKNVTADIKKVCEGNPSCIVPAGNDTLKLTWSCGGHLAEGTFPKGAIAELSCKVPEQK